MNPWKTRCPVCKKFRIIKKGIFQPHPKVNGMGRCEGSLFVKPEITQAVKENAR